MMKLVTSAPSTNSVRFALQGGTGQACHMWRVWAQGDEVYAVVRRGKNHKLSVHSSGQVHLKLGGPANIMARPTQMEASSWYHAFEWRFLTSLDSLTAPAEGVRKSKDMYHLQPVPVGKGWRLHLLVTALPFDEAPDAPTIFKGIRPFWMWQLSSKRWASIMGGIVTLGKESIETRTHYRQLFAGKFTAILNPKVSPYVELHKIGQDQDSKNVLLIIPMGVEAYGSAI